VPYEQIYYNLSFGTKGDYASHSTVPSVRRRYVVDIISHVQESLRSLTEGNYINLSKRDCNKSAHTALHQDTKALKVSETEPL
jgi:hypothetical protein